MPPASSSPLLSLRVLRLTLGRSHVTFCSNVDFCEVGGAEGSRPPCCALDNRGVDHSSETESGFFSFLPRLSFLPRGERILEIPIVSSQTLTRTSVALCLSFLGFSAYFLWRAAVDIKSLRSDRADCFRASTMVDEIMTFQALVTTLFFAAMAWTSVTLFACLLIVGQLRAAAVWWGYWLRKSPLMVFLLIISSSLQLVWRWPPDQERVVRTIVNIYGYVCFWPLFDFVTVVWGTLGFGSPATTRIFAFTIGLECLLARLTYATVSADCVRAPSLKIDRIIESTSSFVDAALILIMLKWSSRKIHLVNVPVMDLGRSRLLEIHG